jgi:hypothetical protein
LLVAATLKWAHKPEAKLIPLQIALAVLTLSTGALGFITGLILSATHLGEVPAGKVVQIAAIGFGESLCGVALALTMIAIAAGVGSIGAMRRVQYA